MVKATHKGARTVVRTRYGKTGEFPINVGLHQGSSLSSFLELQCVRHEFHTSSFLFMVVLDVISEAFRGGLPWELLFADDLTLVAGNEDELQRKWLRWQNAMESRGLKCPRKVAQTAAWTKRRELPGAISERKMPRKL
ncbi:uncharacterized protein LOC134784170 [Penaeus indicus]|uniref:uncharacterized protein LOC134784170 n=1 Tax=Penaeus indicus TaxID=29960 RepID=UPI00300BFAC5